MRYPEHIYKQYEIAEKEILGVKLIHLPTSIGVVCYSERSQYANKEKALTMLEILVELEIGED